MLSKPLLSLQSDERFVPNPRRRGPLTGDYNVADYEAMAYLRNEYGVFGPRSHLSVAEGMNLRWKRALAMRPSVAGAIRAFNRILARVRGFLVRRRLRDYFSDATIYSDTSDIMSIL